MRFLLRSLLLLALAAGCHAAPVREPALTLEQIAVLFQATPIDVDRLKHVLDVRGGELRLIVPEVPAAAFDECLGQWFLENVGTRRLVLSRWECAVRLDLNGFLHLGGRCRSQGGLFRPAGVRPSFTPDDWLILEPGQRIALPRSDRSTRYQGGEEELEASVWITRWGPLLCRYAEDFNQGKETSLVGHDFGGVVYKSVTQVVLPKLPWTEKLWAEHQSVALRPDESGTFTWSTMMIAGHDRPAPLRMEGYLVDYDARVFCAGPLPVVGHRTSWIEKPKGAEKGVLSVMTRYALPEGVPSGNYLLLARVRDAWSFFYEGWTYIPKCKSENQYTAVSSWMPVTVR